MRRRTKWLIGGVATAAVAPWLPAALTAAGLDVWNTPALRQTVADNQKYEALLTAQIDGVRQSIRVKDALADELIAGRLTLAEVTDQYEVLVADNPRLLAGLRTVYPDAATDRERVARHVVHCVRLRLPDAAEQARLDDRMTTELEQLFPPRPMRTTPMG